MAGVPGPSAYRAHGPFQLGPPLRLHKTAMLGMLGTHIPYCHMPCQWPLRRLILLASPSSLFLSPWLQAEKDCEALRAEINRVAVQVAEQETAMAEGRTQIKQLQGVIAEADQVGTRGRGRGAGVGLNQRGSRGQRGQRNRGQSGQRNRKRWLACRNREIEDKENGQVATRSNRPSVSSIHLLC